MKARNFILLVLLALTVFMFAACKNEPAVNPEEGTTLTGVVFDKVTNQPLEGALVSIATASTRTDESGSFAFRNLGDGVYSVSISLEGYVGQVVPVFIGFPREVEEEDEEVAEFKPGTITIEPVMLEPVEIIPGLSGILYGNVAVRFAGCKDLYAVPEGTGIIAMTSVHDEETGADKTLYYRTVVDENGDFMFEGLENSGYALALGKFSVEYAGETVNFDYASLGTIPVIDGVGNAGNLYVEHDGAELAIVSVECISRDEAALDRDVDHQMMHAGDVLRIEFNKNLDPEKADFMFSGKEVVGYTEFAIVENVAYVWHDGIEGVAKGESLYLLINVASYDEGDELSMEYQIDYFNALKLTSTNLYEYDYYGEIIDGLDPMDPIVLVFDKDLPDEVDVELLIQDTEYHHFTEADFFWKVEGNVLYLYGPTAYGKDYWMILKVATEDGVVIFNTMNGLEEEAVAGIIRTGSDFDVIKFSTMDFRAIPRDAKNSLTNVVIDGYTNDMEVYEPEFVVEFNTDIEFLVERGMLKATLTPMIFEDGSRVYTYEPIELDVKAYDNVLVANLGKKKALYPQIFYLFEISVENDVLFGEAGYSVISKIEYEYENPLELLALIDDTFDNGLYSFEVVENEKQHYDSTDKKVEFTWESGRYFLDYNGDEDNGYIILRKGSEKMWMPLLAYFPEKSSYLDWYYDSRYDEKVSALIPHDDLSFHGSVDYILMTIDTNGLMVQSPVRTVEDKVAPTLGKYNAVIEEGTALPEGTEVQFDVFSIPRDSGLEDGEYLDILDKGNVKIETAEERLSPESIKLEWEQDSDHPDRISFTLTFLTDCGSYENGDIKIILTVYDTSGNSSDLVIDFLPQE